MEIGTTGWRSMPAAMVEDYHLDEVSKNQLYTAARLAMRAFGLRSGPRAVLDHLVGCYGGESISGKLLVWPSNEFLSERTGLSERSIRYALRRLIDFGIISSHDSANGKRYARRSPQGQIIAAFGLDLTPLIKNEDEHVAIVERLKSEKARRMRLFDDITIYRRKAMEALSALPKRLYSASFAELSDEFEHLTELTPRRGSSQPIESLVERWQTLQSKIWEYYYSATGGKNSRHKENNKDAPDQSCNKGMEENVGENLTEEVTMVELAAACPDAFAYAGEIQNETDLVYEATRLRGTLGAHKSVWYEGRDLIGPVAAAVSVFMVLQKYSDDQTSAGAIKNPGGYLRAFIRMVSNKQIDLKEEVRAMRRKRAH